MESHVEGLIPYGLPVILLPCSLRKWKYGDGNKNRDVYKRQAIESSMSVDFGGDRLRGKGSLPETFFVVT